MRTLVSVSSCEVFEKSGLNDPLRETWLQDAVALGFDYKFFAGRGATEKNDVVVLDVEDALFGLTEKAKVKAKWAVENKYDFVFSCFPDLYARPERFLSCGYEKYDYCGNVYQHHGGPRFCQGGPGYFLSKRACAIIADDLRSYLNDDCFIADVLIGSGIEAQHLVGFMQCGPGPLKHNNSITNHLSTQPGGYTGHNVLEEHRRWRESLSQS